MEDSADSGLTVLMQSGSGLQRAALLAQLKALQQSCAAARRQPTDRDNYQRLQAAATAVNAAIRIVETIPEGGTARN